MNGAQTAREALLSAMNEMGLSYGKEDENTYGFAYSGDDLPMYFKLSVDEEMQLIVLLSPQQFYIRPEKLRDAAVAVGQINYSLTDGSFDLDVQSGMIVFRMTSSFAGSLVSPRMLEYMIECAVYTVDEYNDKLLLIDSGEIDATEFIRQIAENE